MSASTSSVVSMDQIRAAIKNADLDFITDNQDAIKNFASNPEFRKAMPLNDAMKEMKSVLDLLRRQEAIGASNDNTIKKAAEKLNDTQDIIEILQESGFVELDPKVGVDLYEAALETNPQTVEFMEEKGLATPEVRRQIIVNAVNNGDLEFIDRNREIIAESLAYDPELNKLDPIDMAIKKMSGVLDLLAQGQSNGVKMNEETAKEANEILGNSLGIIASLRESGFKELDKVSFNALLLKACATNQQDLVVGLLEQGANINHYVYSQEKDGAVGQITPLSAAINGGHQELAEALATVDSIIIYDSDLSAAAQQGMVSVAEMAAKSLQGNKKLLASAWSDVAKCEFKATDPNSLKPFETMLAAGVELDKKAIKHLPKEAQEHLVKYDKIAQSMRNSGKDAGTIVENLTPQRVKELQMPKKPLLGIFGVGAKDFDRAVTMLATAPQTKSYNDKKVSSDEWQQKVTRDRSNSIQTNRSNSSVSL